jgi:activator of HSP90 ATPase
VQKSRDFFDRKGIEVHLRKVGQEISVEQRRSQQEKSAYTCGNNDASCWSKSNASTNSNTHSYSDASTNSNTHANSFANFF